MGSSVMSSCKNILRKVKEDIARVAADLVLPSNFFSDLQEIGSLSCKVGITIFTTTL